MRKKILFLSFFSITITIIYLLNTQFSSIPPLGKFLNPYNGFWKNAEIDQIKSFEKIKLNNLRESVIIQYDSLLIPHIYSKNDLDLFYTQGYLTAFHRLWQMEFQIKAAAGELSEIFGKRALKRDREQRRKGIIYAAKRTYNKSISDKNTFELLESYVKGVNDYIESLEYSDYPIEYKLLDYKPQKWSLLKTFILMESMSDMLSSRDMDIEDTYIMNIIGKEKYDILFPEYDSKIKPIIPSGTNFNFVPEKISTPEYLNFDLDYIEQPLKH